MADQSQIQRSQIRILTVPLAGIAAPVDGDEPAGTTPLYVMSPRAPVDFDSTGLQFMFDGGSTAVAGVGGFNVILWERDPTTKAWANFVTVAVALRQWFVTFDLDAAEVFLEIGNVAGAGNLRVHFAEL